MGSVELDADTLPTQLPGTSTFRYYLAGEFDIGDIRIEFLPGTVSLLGYPDYTNEGTTQGFSVAVPTIRLDNPLSGSQPKRDDLRDQKYFEITFNPVNGNTLDVGSILDDEAEFDEKLDLLLIARILEEAAKALRDDRSDTFDRGDFVLPGSE